MNDPVNHPKHYTAHPSGIECIEITRHMNFNIGNAVKYLWRHGQKDASKTIEDLEKAKFYIEDEINRLKGCSKSVASPQGGLIRNPDGIARTGEPRVSPFHPPVFCEECKGQILNTWVSDEHSTIHDGKPKFCSGKCYLRQASAIKSPLEQAEANIEYIPERKADLERLVSMGLQLGPVSFEGSGGGAKCGGGSGGSSSIDPHRQYVYSFDDKPVFCVHCEKHVEKDNFWIDDELAGFWAYCAEHVPEHKPYHGVACPTCTLPIHRGECKIKFL